MILDLMDICSWVWKKWYPNPKTHQTRFNMLTCGPNPNTIYINLDYNLSDQTRFNMLIRLSQHLDPPGLPDPYPLSLCTPYNILVFRTFKNTKLLKIFSNYRPNSLSFKYSKLINKCTLQLNPHLCWIWLLSDPLKILFGFEVEIPFQILLLKPRRRPLSLVLLL
jgi:hypothetical protein